MVSFCRLSEIFVYNLLFMEILLKEIWNLSSVFIVNEGERCMCVGIT